MVLESVRVELDQTICRLHTCDVRDIIIVRYAHKLYARGKYTFWPAMISLDKDK